MDERHYDRDRGTRRPEGPPHRRKRRRRRRRGGLGGLLLTGFAVVVAIMLLHSALKMPKDPEPENKEKGTSSVSYTPSGSAASSGDGQDAGKTGTPSDGESQSSSGDPTSAEDPTPSTDPDPLDPAVPQIPTEPTDPQTPSEPGEPDPVQSEDWELMLVNPWHAMPRDYEITTKSLSNGHSVDERCYDALQDMLSACRADGLTPVVCSSFRSWEKQEQLYQNKVERLKKQGYSDADALTEAGKEVAVPGTSEHQLGLAVDIVDVTNQNLDESQEKTAVQKWLMEHCYEYGFILRFPNDKSEITGIIYEPWHYRYVGKAAAKEIYDQGICLEEYLENLEQ